MSEQNRGLPELRFPDGSTITSFVSFTATDDYTDPLYSLDFEAAPPRDQYGDYTRLLQKGELVTLRIGGASQGAFIMQTIQKSISADGGMRFRVSAKCPLVTPHQGSVDPDLVNINSQTDVPVADFILQVLRPYGFDTLVADTRASVQSLTGATVKGRARETMLAKLKHRDAQVQDGESALTTVNRVISRLGVCIRFSPQGVLNVGAPDYEQASLYNITNGAGPGDRFIDGSLVVTETNDDQYSEVTTRGNRVTTATTTQTSRPKSTITSDVVHTRARYRSTPANHKPLNRRDKHARDPERCASVAKRILGKRAHKAFQIDGQVDGFVSSTGAVWSVDTMATIKIDALEINEDFWLLSRTFTMSGSEGAKTSLKFIPLGTLLLGDIPE